MKENLFDVLIYLFENYYMDEEHTPGADRESLQLELNEAGFPIHQVNQAFDWLDGLSTQSVTPNTGHQTRHAMRVYHGPELERLDTECRGFLLFLEQMGILTPIGRELVVDRVMALGTDDLDLEQLKWVVLMVLFNQPGEEAAYAWMEDLVLDSMTGSLH